MKKKEIALVCFQILGRHFPPESGADSEALRDALNVPQNFNISNADWKAAACNWLTNNVSFKR